MKTKNKINERFDVGFWECPDTGKYITLKLTQEEFYAAMTVRFAFQEHGIKIPLTGVVRKMMQVGTDNLNMDEVKSNPFAIFSQLNEPVPPYTGEAA